MKIKWKVIVLVMLVVFFTCVTFMYLMVSQDKKNLNEEIAREIKSIRSSVEVWEKEKYQAYQIRIQSFIKDEVETRKDLLRAFAQRNRSDLLAKSQPFLNLLKKENPYLVTFAWITEDNKNYLRVHSPDSASDDDISKMRPDIVEANKTHSMVTSYQVSRAGFQYRIVQPVDYEGQHVGAVQFGIDTMLLLDSINEKLEIPVVMALSNDKVQFATHPNAHSLTGPSHTLYSSRLNIFQLNEVPINWSLETQKISHQERRYRLVRVFDFLNYADELQGGLFIALDTTLREKNLFDNIVFIAFISGTVLFFTFIVLHLSFSKFIGTIEALNSKLLKQNKDLEAAVNKRTASLQQSEDRFKKLSSLTFEGIIIHNKGIVQDTNSSLIKMFGYTEEEMIGKNAVDLLIPSEYHSKIYAGMENHIPNCYEVVARKKDGTLFPIEVEARSIANETANLRVTAIRDITQRKQAEEKHLELEDQLRQKYKMEAVGVMAGGMAHNFNNNLSIILGNVELSKMKMPASSEIGSYLDNAKIAVLRARDLIQQILTYSRQGVKDKTSMQLPLVIDETLQLLHSTMPTTINLQQRIGSDGHDLTINADSSQIQECLINLCNNAMYAMEEEGDLTIALDSVELQKHDIPVQYESRPGRYAKLSVQDNGSGMSAETVDKIFDLFYTTKPVDEGTGVGLSTVQGIVTQHGGLIKVSSQLGKGTTFELFFPVTEQSQTAEITSTNQDLPRGTEQILFIDDDEMLANLGGELLTEMGYQVSIMTDSAEALKMFTANADHFDLVITDQTMPDLTGKDLILELKKVRPDIPTILCTGFSSKIDEVKAAELAINAFLMKPLDLPELSQTVRRVLDGK